MVFCFLGFRLSGHKAKEDHKTGHDEPSGDGAGGVVEGGKEGAFCACHFGRHFLIFESILARDSSNFGRLGDTP